MPVASFWPGQSRERRTLPGMALDWISPIAWIKETGAHVGARELYDAYKAWSEALKDYTRSEKDFSAEMEKLGISKRKSHGINTYFGLRLNDRQNRSNRWYDNEIL